jgi:hypothetical protein
MFRWSGGELYISRSEAVRLGANLDTWFALGKAHHDARFSEFSRKVDACCARIDAILNKPSQEH